MEYLRTKSVSVDGHMFDLVELTYAGYQKANVENEQEGALMTVCAGCKQFMDTEPEEVAKLPMRLVIKLSMEIIKLSSVEEDATGNSSSTPVGGLSSVSP